MNAVSSALRSGAGTRRFIDCVGFGAVIVPNDHFDQPDGAVITIGLRPERICLSTARPESNHCQLREIKSAAYCGGVTYYQVSVVGLHKPVVVASLNSEPNGNANNFCEGIAVWLIGPTGRVKAIGWKRIVAKG